MAVSTQVHVVAGPAGCGKTQRLLERYALALREIPFGRALWIAPTGRSVRILRERLLASGVQACFQPGLTTFGKFASAVLAAANQPIRLLTDGMKSELLRQLIDEFVEQKQLAHFAPIAKTEGFLKQASGFISELKRLEIWPEHFQEAVGPRGLSRKDRDLVQLYTAYQKRLLEHQLYDREGRFWEARDLLSKGQRRPFEQVDLLVVDGFTDLTRTQHEMLELLSGRAKEVWFSLVLEQDSERGDLFAKTQTTLQELKRRYPRADVTWLPRRSMTWPAWSHLEQTVFSNPRNIKPSTDATGIEVLAAARQDGEIEMLARTIKRLLTKDQVAPQDILVVFRNMAEVAPLVREVFTEFGLPFVVEASRPLRESPTIAALLDVLRLAAENWPFRRLLAVLSNTVLRPQWPEFNSATPTENRSLQIAVEHLIRELQIPSGREVLFERVAFWANAEISTESNPAHRHQEKLHNWAKQTWPLLQHWHELLSSLPSTATPRVWAAAIKTVATELGLFAADASREINVAAAQAAWKVLEIALHGSERLAQFVDEPLPQWSLAELLEELDLILRQEQLPESADETGCVRVLSAQSVRTLTTKYLFVAGLAEQSFPPVDRDDRLYGELEYRTLVEAGLPLVDRTGRSQEEMLLFYEVVTRATQRLYLSYPALDEKAQPLSSSPYVDEIRRLFQPDAISTQHVTDLHPAAHSGDLLSPADWRLHTIHSALPIADETKPRTPEKWLAGLVQNEACLANNLMAALRLSQARQTGQEYGVYEGVLSSSSIRNKLALQYGPDHCWTASQLEQYASCPHRFYLDRVLGIKPLPELALDLDHQTRGWLLHEVLAKLHRGLLEKQASKQLPAKIDRDQLLQFFKETVEACVAKLTSEDGLATALTEIDRRTLLEWGQKYAEQAEQYELDHVEMDAPLRPQYFEIAFGPDLSKDEIDPISRSEPFVLQHPLEQIKLAGRIDRLDVGRAGGAPVFNVLDYKSGKSRGLKKDDILKGQALQLPLYAIVAEEMLLQATGAMPWEIGYWFVKENGFKLKQAIQASSVADGSLQPDEEWIALKQAIVEKVVSFVRAVRHADFPMHSANEDCTSMCEFKTVCRVQQTRSLRKQWEPPPVS